MEVFFTHYKNLWMNDMTDVLIPSLIWFEERQKGYYMTDDSSHEGIHLGDRQVPSSFWDSQVRPPAIKGWLHGRDFFN